MGQKIAPNATELTITDTLSENVTLVNDTELKAEVFKMKANGVDTDGKALTEPQLKELGLNRFILEKPNPALQQGGEIKLTTDPSDFSLPAGYEIRLTATIKPSAKAYEKLRKGQATTDRGGERTDLQDIYRKEKITLPNDYSNAAVYGTSAGKYGLFTNNEAYFSYKWKGKTPKTPYNNPIVKVQNRDLIIEKQIVGLKGEGYKVIENDKSKIGGVPEQKITELGKAILRDIKITVYEVQEDGKDKEYVSFKLYRDESLEDQGKELEFTVGNVAVKRHQVVYNKPYDRLSFSYTITGLNPNKKYRVVEDVPEKSYGYASEKDSYKLISKDNNTDEKAFALTEHSAVTIKNTYQPKEPKTDITVKKVVREFNGTAVTKEAKDKEFDFYLGLFTDQIVNNVNKRKSFTKEELETIVNDYNQKPDKEKKLEVIKLDNIEIDPETGTLFDDALEAGHYVIHFKLKHNEKITLPLDNGIKYRVYEKQEDGYNKPKYSITEEKSGVEEFCTVIKANGLWYACTASKVVNNTTVTLYNPRITLVPTGLVNDFTPYLWGIFGFVAMAGAYLTISKKRREV